MSSETKKILGGLEFSGYIFLAFCLWMTLTSFAFRPQVDVIGMAGADNPSVSCDDSSLCTREPVRDERAEEMARVVYGTALYNSPEAQEAVMWCIVNRTESPIYPDTVEEVCRQPSQWMGYAADNPVVDRLYDMAVEVLDAWEQGGERNLPKDCLYLVWDGNDSITFRTAFEGGNKWVVE